MDGHNDLETQRQEITIYYCLHITKKLLFKNTGLFSKRSVM